MDNNPLDLNFENKGDLRGCLEAALQESVPNRGFPEVRLARRDPARQFLRRARKALLSTYSPRGRGGGAPKAYVVREVA